MFKRASVQSFTSALLWVFVASCADEPVDTAPAKEPSSTTPDGPTPEGPTPDAPTKDAPTKDAGAARDAGRSTDAGRGTQKPPAELLDAADHAVSSGDAGGGVSTPDAASSPADDASVAQVSCPTTALAAGDITSTVQVAGMSRTFILHVPKGYTGKSAVPLVLDWHGLGSSGSGQAGVSGYKALSDKEGFVIAWPNGIDSAWNVGPCCTKSRTVDDLAFAKAVVDDVKKRACIDPKRVYADGYSMGGGMSHYLACNAADVFAAVAPSAFDLLSEDEEPCHPSRPISVISFRGTSDPIVKYAGGASMPPNGLSVTIHFLGAQNTFKKWAELNGCTGTPSESGDGCSTYGQCKDGVEVTLCTKQGGGHDPGDAKRGWETLKKYALP